MALVNAPQIITNGLVFCYDMFNAKSFKGAPTTNYAHDQNPRLGDTSYSVYSATSSGTWNAKHPDAIRVYNKAGTELSGYVNTGVTDWTNTYHAIWTYDYDLDKPVVTMRDYDGQWKAKSWGTGQTYASMGLSAGSTYTISWLQWTDDLGKSANAGLYSNIGFGDGLSNDKGATAYNTKIRTWQRVYATFTVNGTSNLASGISAFMYGHYGPRGTVKISDVQIEVGSVPSRFNDGLTRSNTQSVVDLTGNNAVTVAGLTYANDNTFSFNGSSNYTSINSVSTSGNAARSVFAWIKTSTGGCIFSSGTAAPSQAFNLVTYGSSKVGVMGYNNDFYPTSGANITNNAWHYVGAVASGNGTITTYVDGVLDNTGSVTYSTVGQSNFVGKSNHAGAESYWNGSIASVHYYNRALLAAEIKSNYNALKGKFGL